MTEKEKKYVKIESDPAPPPYQQVMAPAYNPNPIDQNRINTAVEYGHVITNVRPGVLKAYKALKYMAVVNLILAITCVVFGSACIGTSAAVQRSSPYGPRQPFCFDGSGIWVGVLCIITSSLGTAALGVPAGRRCLLTSYFVMLIISSIGFGILLIFSSIWASLAAERHQQGISGDSGYLIAILIFNIILIISAIIQFLLSIITCSLICYNWNCCQCQPATVQVIQQPIEYHVHPVQT